MNLFLKKAMSEKLYNKNTVDEEYFIQAAWFLILFFHVWHWTQSIVCFIFALHMPGIQYKN